MAYNFQQLVDLFINGETEGVSTGEGNLKLVGNKLIHYDTTIAERFEGKYYVNVCRYSLVTGQLQKKLKNSIPNELYIERRSIPKGFKGSLYSFQKL